jgi:hypothetical protein
MPRAPLSEDVDDAEGVETVNRHLGFGPPSGRRS